jgi:hypothetical protein
MTDILSNILSRVSYSSLNTGLDSQAYIQSKVDTLSIDLPGISFGYIGNLQWGPMGDYREWHLFLPHPDRVGGYLDSVSLGHRSNSSLTVLLHEERDIMKKKPEAMILTTTLRLLRNAHACTSRYTFLREALGPKYGDNKPINLLAILKTNGLDDALWALQATAQNCDMVARLMAADFAARVLPIWAKKYPKDDRPAKAIKATRDFARGKITSEELAAARDAVWDAMRDATRDATRDAADAAARDAVWDAARDAVWDATRDAADAAARDAAWAAARVAADAAGVAADAAGAAEKNRQQSIFVSYLLESEGAE